MFEMGQTLQYPALQSGLANVLDPQVIASAAVGAGLTTLSALLIQRWSRSQERQTTQQKLRIALKGEIESPGPLDHLRGEWVIHELFPTHIYDRSIDELGLLTEEEVGAITAYYSSVFVYEDAVRLWQETRRDGIAFSDAQQRSLESNLGHYLEIVLERREKVLSALDEHVQSHPSTPESSLTPTEYTVGTVSRKAARGVSAEHAPESNRRSRIRPAPPGVSISHPATSAGTLGTPPLRTDDGTLVFLTSGGVAAPPGSAKQGDPILQPGVADGASVPNDKIGELYAWSEPSVKGSNTTDVALVEIEEGAVSREILGIGELKGWTEGEIGEEYLKSGRTSEVTSLTLEDRGMEINIGGYSEEPARFEGLDMFSGGIVAGDAGSLVVREESDGVYGVSLLFAGNEDIAFGIPIQTIQSEFGPLHPV